MKNKIEYTIEKFPLGFTISKPAGTNGIGIEVLADCLPLFEKVLGEKTIIGAGIAEHLKSCGHPNTIFCITTEKNAEIWVKEIKENNKNLDKEDQWWSGTEKGMSSAAIFSTFCKEKYRVAAESYSNGYTPKDPGDFSRCQNLLKTFPEWKANINNIADKYPKTPWVEIIKNWDKLEKLDNKEQYELLKKLNSKNYSKETPQQDI